MATQTLQQEVENTLGQVPAWMNDIAPPAAEHSWALMRDLELGETELTTREKELIGLGVAAAVGCPYCTFFHTEGAKLDGATDAELTEAVNIAASTRYFSTILHGARTDLEQFEAETAEIMDYVREQAGASAGD